MAAAGDADNESKGKGANPGYYKLLRRKQRGIGVVLKYLRPKGRRIRTKEIKQARKRLGTT